MKRAREFQEPWKEETKREMKRRNKLKREEKEGKF